MSEDSRVDCPDCGDEGVSRRDFVRRVAGAGAAVAGGLLPFAASNRTALAAPSPSSAAETNVKRFYDTLTDDQKKTICFPFDHELRSKINANWGVTKPTIDTFFNKDQQKLLDDITRGVLSPEGYERMQKQMEDDSGGFGEYHVAVFGTPGSGQFEWELTGRHVTLRADGDSVANTAFGGPVVYGHGAGDGKKGLPGNVYYYQIQKANEVFKALDGKQRDSALLKKAPKETDVLVQGTSGRFPGLAVGELAADQKKLVESVMKVILSPYREEDVDEALAIVKSGGGLDALHMAFYEGEDLGDDHEWDIWRLEGPNFVWHFRGAPHVHTYVNIAKKA
jgi:Protein of unknown function (DUF3500)